MSDDEEADFHIVIDNGTRWIKAGFSADQHPRSVFRTIVLRSKEWKTNKIKYSDYYVGQERRDRGRYGYSLKEYFPIKSGIINEFDNMETVWHHTFYNELRIDPEEHSILLTETAFNPKTNREKTTEILFETFYCKSMCIKTCSVLSLIGIGKQTGIVINSGYDHTSIVPVYELRTLRNKAIKTGIGGHDVSTCFLKTLNDHGHSMYSSYELDMCNNIKKKLCIVAPNTSFYHQICNNSSNGTKYELPDGQMITLQPANIYTPTECLFDPQLVGKKCKGIDKLLCDVLMKNDIYFGENIVLNGGNTVFNGIGKRLQYEMDNSLNLNIDHQLLVNGYLRNNYYSKNKLPLSKDIMNLIYYHLPKSKVKIHAPHSREYLSFAGGSIFASLTSFDDECITNKEYEEYGKSIVDRNIIDFK